MIPLETERQGTQDSIYKQLLQEVFYKRKNVESWLEGTMASWGGFLTLEMLYHVFMLMVETDNLGMTVDNYRSKLHA